MTNFANSISGDNFVKYDCRAISLLLMLGQVTFFVPKFWRLQSFALDAGIVTVINGSGRIFNAPLNELIVEYSIDGHDRRFVTIVWGKEKFRYQEIIGQLEKEEWDHICTLFGGKMSSFGHFQNIVSGGAIKNWALKKAKFYFNKFIKKSF